MSLLFNNFVYVCLSCGPLGSPIAMWSIIYGYSDSPSAVGQTKLSPSTAATGKIWKKTITADLTLPLLVTKAAHVRQNAWKPVQQYTISPDHPPFHMPTCPTGQLQTQVAAWATATHFPSSTWNCNLTRTRTTLSRGVFASWKVVTWPALSNGGIFGTLF